MIVIIAWLGGAPGIDMRHVWSFCCSSTMLGTCRSLFNYRCCKIVKPINILHIFTGILNVVNNSRCSSINQLVRDVRDVDRIVSGCLARDVQLTVVLGLSFSQRGYSNTITLSTSVHLECSFNAQWSSHFLALKYVQISGTIRINNVIYDYSWMTIIRESLKQDSEGDVFQ